MGGEGWEPVLLGDVAQDLTVGFVGSMASEYVEHGVPFLRSQNIAPFRLDFSDVKFINAEFHAKLKKSALKPGDVVIVRTGKPGTAAVIPDGTEELNCSDLVIVRPGENLNSRFLCYHINGIAGHHVRAHLVGAVQQHFNVGAARKLPMLLPSVPEQRRIAAVLGALDDKIELNRKMNQTLEAMAQALFKSWFVDFDPVIDNALRAGNPIPDDLQAKATRRRAVMARDSYEIPPYANLFPDSFEDSELGSIPIGWTAAKIGDIVDRQKVGKKYNQKTVESKGEVPVLDQGKSGIIGYHNDEPGVIASLEAPVGIFANHTCLMKLITFSFSAIQNVLPFKGKGLDTFWVFYATLGKQAFSEYKGHWPDFVIHKVPVPPTGLAISFREKVKPLIARMRSNTLEATTLAALRDTLLPKLISGEVRVPASAVPGVPE